MKLKDALSDLADISIEPHGAFSSQITFRQDQISLVSLLSKIQPKLEVEDFKVREMDMESVIHKVYSGALA